MRRCADAPMRRCADEIWGIRSAARRGMALTAEMISPKSCGELLDAAWPKATARES
jgi:hypothetical protein